MTDRDTVYQNCPHFAVANDPTTGLLFPSQMGRCFRTKPETAVSLDHQQTFCLSPNHPTCPIYCQTQPAPPAPQASKAAPRQWGLLPTAVLLLGLLSFAIWQFAMRPATTPLPTVAAVAAVANTSTPSATATTLPSAVPTLTATATASATFTPTPTVTATPLPLPTQTAVSAIPIPATPTPELPSVVVNVERLNVRSGPSTDYPILLLAEEGTQFTAVGSVSAQDWWQVCCVNGELAWVVAEAVTFVGDETAVPPAIDIPPAPTAEP